MNARLSEHYFGDVEAIDEGRNFPAYFKATYVMPTSFSTNSLNNRRKYIVTGRKGSGKTACQFHMSQELEDRGYLTKFFSFYADMKPRDYSVAVQSQGIDLVKTQNPKNIFLNYDFREIWERTFLSKICEVLQENGLESGFTKFVLGDRNRLSGIFEGVLRSASLKIKGDLFGISAEVGVDLSEFSQGEVPLHAYLAASRELLLRHASDYKVFLFVDELVFSKLDAKDDEVRLRAAMVRDIFRAARDLNNFFAQNDLDFHIICSVRPEIRNLINDLDSEIGKIIDGKSVELTWEMGEDEDSLLYRLLKQKVIHSDISSGKTLNFGAFMDQEIVFSRRKVNLSDFLLTNTWARPRDVVRLLTSIADKSPDATRIGIEQIKAALDEYSRRSMKEIVDEISVRGGPLIGSRLRQSVTRREYRDLADFRSEALSDFKGHDFKVLIEDLFHFGVIGNYDDRFRSRRYYWFHRGEEFLKGDLGVVIHPGLWNYFNIR